MKPRSAKAKGRNLQNLVAEKIRELFALAKEDVKPAIMGEKGEDIKLSSTARKLFPFSVECKNLNRISVYKYFEQAKENCNGHTPLVVLKQNHSEPLVLLPLDAFLSLLVEDKSYIKG